MSDCSIYVPIARKKNSRSRTLFLTLDPTLAMLRPAPTLRLDDAREPTDVDARDRAWILRLRGGDYSAFDAMFSAYADPLAAYVYGLLNSREDAQEIVQDLFLWVWEHRDRWDVPGQLRTYFYRSTQPRDQQDPASA